ncbi:MAG TPA: PH domain-containing protein [Puia sp.]|jgi:membrane protein YdbS with pleckstrin-like domain|nr:PH domain-containing protein [Puia sp.]
MRTPLQKEEKILLVTYSSWTSLIGPVFVTLLLVAMGIFVVYHFNFVGGWLLSLLGLFYWLLRYYSWKVNIWVVTNFRVIDEAGLLNHYAKESPLDKINNVSYDQTLAGRLFNFGHVEIQTAAEAGATDYYNVNHPKRLKDTITAAQAEYKNWQYGNQAIRMAEVLDARHGVAGGKDTAAVSARANAPAIAQELEKLFELKMKGALSEEEYNRAKAKLLNH